METDMTVGSPARGILNFTLPIFIGNIFQQLYNMADAVIVGKFVGPNALAAVGSCGTLMFLIIGFLQGLTAGFTVITAQHFGAGNMKAMRQSVASAYILSAVVSVIMTVLSMSMMKQILGWMNTPPEIYSEAYGYIMVICAGIVAQVLYNLLASILRALGNSKVPLYFLILAAFLNVVLDLVFILRFGMGVGGAAWATVLAQGLSAVCMAVYFLLRARELRPRRSNMHLDRGLLHLIFSNSVLTAVQQSIMNLGILMVQGLVNSFGPSVMAAFAAAVKIDSFAYMPVQDFGNAFSTFVAQNYGAGKGDRIRQGLRTALKLSGGFCILSSACVALLARPLMLLFIEPEETEIIAVGVTYLHIEGIFYIGIGILFLLYALPGLGAAGDVHRAHRGLSWHPGGPGLRPVRSARCGPCGHLVVCAHRLGPGRSPGPVVLSPPAQDAAARINLWS